MKRLCFRIAIIFLRKLRSVACVMGTALCGRGHFTACGGSN